jgi:hypothetical protein
VVIAPEIDFAVLVAFNRDTVAWKARQTVQALIRTFAPKRTQAIEAIKAHQGSAIK